MLIPAEVNLQGVKGRDWDASFQLWQDAAQTIPYPLDGVTVTLGIDHVRILTVGDGLTLTVDQGIVAAALTPAQTRGVPDRTLYRVKLDGTKHDCVINGVIEWITP